MFWKLFWKEVWYSFEFCRLPAASLHEPHPKTSNNYGIPRFVLIFGAYFGRRMTRIARVRTICFSTKVDIGTQMPRTCRTVRALFIFCCNGAVQVQGGRRSGWSGAGAGQLVLVLGGVPPSTFPPF